jgi:hypothetical protein
MRVLLCGGLVLLAVTAAPQAGRAEGKPEDYLTKDGALKHPLEVSGLRGGFAGFTGTRLVVQPNGEWALARVARGKDTITAKGKLARAQLAALAEALAKYDLQTLKDVERPAGANPHVLEVRFGKKVAKLTLGAGRPLPKAGTHSLPARFVGILAAARAVTAAKKD